MRSRSLSKLAGGGSSVLVVLLMLFIVTLGTLTLTSTQTNLKLAQRSTLWFKTCYLLDASGEVLTDTIFKIITLTRAQQLLSNTSYRDQLVLSLSDSIKDYTSYGKKTLPFEATVTEVKIESGDDYIVLKINLSKDHDDIRQNLLLEIQVLLKDVKLDTPELRILKWEHYREPFEYEDPPSWWR